MVMVAGGLDALHSLRRARRSNRLADLDWFEAAYRVYVVALGYGWAALWLSSFVKDDELSAAGSADFARQAPGWLGLAVVIAAAAGLRGGSQGGPLALEEGDVRHLLLAPIDRRRVLLRPAVQRLRSAVFAGALVGALAGELTGRRLPGTVLAWTISGAAFGAALGALHIGCALLAHGLHLTRPVALACGAIPLGWQTVALIGDTAGPGNLVGHLPLWAITTRPLDLVALAAVLAVVIAGFALLGRTSLDAMSRRSGLVSQLRFAVTMQDLRTVMLLRRQLSQESTRSRPWIRLRRSSPHPIAWRRGWQSLLRFPAGRLLRMAVVAIAFAAAHAATFSGTTPMFLIAGALGFLLGTEVLEPLSQDIDQPDRAASFAIDRGPQMLKLTSAPLAALVPYAAIGVATMAVLGASGEHLVAAAILAVPSFWAGTAGAVVGIVMGAPNTVVQAQQAVAMPSELSGLTTTMRMLLPLILATVPQLGTLLVRSAADDGNSLVGAAVRVVAAQLLLCAAVGWWVARRDVWRARIGSFLAEGRQASTQQRQQRQTGGAT